MLYVYDAGKERKFEQRVKPSSEWDPVLKETLKKLKYKLKDKADDYVINEIFTTVRTTGITPI